jgi:hypothetical protein
MLLRFCCDMLPLGTLEGPPIWASLLRCCEGIDILPFVFPLVMGLGAAAPALCGGCADILMVYSTE